MASIENLFILETPYEEDKKEFYRFMNKHAQTFVSAMGNTRYRVPYLLVRSVVNDPKGTTKGAKHRYRWMWFSMILDTYDQPNSRYNNLHKMQICKMLIDESRGSYQRLMNLIKDFVDDFYNSDWQFNVVKYSYEDNYNRMGQYTM